MSCSYRLDFTYSVNQWISWSVINFAVKFFMLGNSTDQFGIDLYVPCVNYRGLMSTLEPFSPMHILDKRAEGLLKVRFSR